MKAFTWALVIVGAAVALAAVANFSIDWCGMTQRQMDKILPRVRDVCVAVDGTVTPSLQRIRQGKIGEALFHNIRWTMVLYVYVQTLILPPFILWRLIAAYRAGRLFVRRADHRAFHRDKALEGPPVEV